MDVFTLRAARRPLLVSIPHAGTMLPDGFAGRLTPAALLLPDTDWHLDRLYDFLDDLGVGILRARYSRFVVDVNRPPDDAPLYSGTTTGLFPAELFDGTAVYRSGEEPGPAERQERLEGYWQPYHRALAAELARIQGQFGIVGLFDAHSVASVVPRLFDGRLTDFNLGTNGGRSLAAEPAQRLLEVCAGAAADGFSHVRDGRFKGGFITRHYGDPARGRHAVQLELTQASYMDEQPPFGFAPVRAERVRPHLVRFVKTLLAWLESAQSPRE
jgi:N-formylglutamate amidohydrolase